MIKFIYGNHGCGKTQYIYDALRADAESGVEAILLVPEQMTVIAERRAAEYLPANAQLKVEVLNFTRLCNRVFRQTGGLVCTHATEGIRRITMQRALKEVGPLLHEYGINAMNDVAMPEKMLSVYDEFIGCGISVDEIAEAVKKLPAGNTKKKLSDISTVISVYKSLIDKNFVEPQSDLERLCNINNPEEVFGNTKFYLDSFSGLTGLQHRVVKLFMKYAKDVTISVPMSGPGAHRPDTESLERMSAILRADAAASGVGNETVILSEPHRYKNSPAINALGSLLWSSDRDVYENDDANDVITLINTSDEYDEAEACAAEIRKLVSSGYRYKDIAVIARHADSVKGITDRALEEAGINVFLSEKTPLADYAPARVLLSALRILSGGWQRADVSAHIKTGLCGIRPEDADIFEIYVDTWKISGRGFTSGEWLMNPDGYREDLTSRGKIVLEKANAVREKICSKLSVLEEKIKSAKSCQDICRALYEYMLELHIPEQMRKRAENAAEKGRIREAKENARIFDEITNVLDQVNDAYTDAECPDINEFAGALKIGLDSYSLGSIPVSSDSVVIASADTARVDMPKCVILTGVYDGSFPAVPARDGLFGVKEREELSSVLKLMRDRETASSDELYFLRRAICFASDRLIIFTKQDEASVAVSNIKRILPKLKAVSSDMDITDRINSPATAAAYSHLLGDTPEGIALDRILTELGGTDPAGLSKETPIDSVGLSVEPEAAAAATGSDLVLSQSKLETFLSCPFKYYCKYTLGLTPDYDSAFSFAPIGTFVHAILENYLRTVFTERGGAFPDDSEREGMLDKITADILSKIAPIGSGQRTARLEHVTQRLRSLADIITGDVKRELCDSDFVPAAFELKIGRDGIPPLKFKMKNGADVSLEGYIDRVDVFRDGNTAYLRTVDYKTGSKTFSFDDIDKGENLQLLLYLFSLTRNENPVDYFGPGLGLSEGAFEYISANVPKVEAKTSDSEGIISAAEEEIARSGAIRQDENVLHAVSNSAIDKYLLGNEKKRKTLDDSGFDNLFEKVSSILVECADSISEGKASATPRNGLESCQYCEYANVCRSARNKKE